MKCSNFYRLYSEIKSKEYAELEAALEAHGGAFDFRSPDYEGDMPYILVYDERAECAHDVVASSVRINEAGVVEVMATDPNNGEPIGIIDNANIYHEQICTIIECIPETDDVKSVAKNS